MAKPRRSPAPATVDALARQLEINGTADLQTFVDGPIVVMDLDTRTTTTLCGPAAIAAARDWGMKLADPSRGKRRCFVTHGRAVCVQSAPSIIQVELEDSGHRT